ncbi:MAG: outer membrane lipoprotein carrier protein LolA [Nitrospira sp.]
MYSEWSPLRFRAGFFKRILLLSSVLALVFPAFNVLGEEELKETNNINDIVAQIHETYDKMEDFKARFVQTVEIFDFNVPYVSKGNLFIKKGKMRWDYHEPSRQQIFVDGGGFHYYVPEHKQVIRSRVGGRSDVHLPLQLLSGRGQLNEDFDLSFEEEGSSVKGSVSLRLVPKKKMGLIKIVIRVAPSPQIGGLMIHEAVLREENGNISTSTFEGIEINKGLEDNIFVFKIPKGVEVLDAP